MALKFDETKSPEDLFALRLATNLTLVKEGFFSLYQEERHKAYFTRLIDLLPRLFSDRPTELKFQDLVRVRQQGNWYQSEKMVGMQLYTNHFNKDLKGLRDKLPYFEELGVNFLHLMPITTRPKEENDGGYAVNSYHEIDKKFGTKNDLEKLTQELRSRKMFLMLDFVVNHTSNEYPWAKKAIAGSKKYRSYYFTYPDRDIPDAFEETLPEVFPQTSPGNFTYNKKMKRWVMTVFNDYQWDLNYSNPEVFLEMLTNLVKLINLGVDVVRFDALAFLWKKIRTTSQNLPEAHMLISLFRMCLQIIAPGTVLLAEAIVAPTEIIKYFGEESRKGNECEMAYNASLMALLWNSIATKKTNLLQKSLQEIPKKPDTATWINYIRCHDDIGLGFDDAHIYDIGWDAKEHRKFLLDYYCQVLPWSPAKGLVFMYNPKNGDGRITGSAASLLGLEKGIMENNEKLIKAAIDKIVMMHGIVFSYGGIPMIYAGDEIGMLNDYSFLEDPNKKHDSRWVNRPQQDWETIAALQGKKGHSSEIFFRLQKMIALRKKLSVFADSNNFVLHAAPNQHLLTFERNAIEDKSVLVLSNFDENPQTLSNDWLQSIGFFALEGVKDIISNKKIKTASKGITLQPYELLWLQKL
ncbi:alpha-amylase family protein [Costertonia aggregata]|uniref:alpha-amylase family protein n=1 Tax=Costertonia aggregata TaxID=343403 RepID=UPI001D14D324|nr:alpha-amylase family protein [Costertonia aggregata]